MEDPSRKQFKKRERRGDGEKEDQKLDGQREPYKTGNWRRTGPRGPAHSLTALAPAEPTGFVKGRPAPTCSPPPPTGKGGGCGCLQLGGISHIVLYSTEPSVTEVF